MKNKDYKMTTLKQKIKDYENRGVSILNWRLHPNQVEYIEHVLHKCVDPYLYEIKTKPFVRIRDVHNTLLKDIHYSYKRGKDFLVRPLSDLDKKTLKENGIKFRTVKYHIYLKNS